MRMRMRMLKRAGVLFAAALGMLGATWVGAAAQTIDRLEIGGNYSYVRTNAPPGGCGCFSLNGGAGWVGYDLTPKLGTGSLALIGEFGGGHASDVNSTTANLTLTSYMAGPRLAWRRGMVSPFAQILLGGAHASGELTPTSAGTSGSANSFAMAAGGGVDIRLTRHLGLRAVQLDYYLTRFMNGVNDQQNNLRVSVGVVWRFGGGK
jgi:outer membrane immunogenic protein